MCHASSEWGDGRRKIIICAKRPSGYATGHPMQYFAPMAVLWALACAPRVARAQDRPIPVVTQQRGTELCPDAEALAMRVERIRSGAQARDIASYHVEFTRLGDEFAALIRHGEGEPHVRTITARGASCDGLAQATAVTLALLLDGADEPPSAQAAPEPTPPEPSVSASTLSEPSAPAPATSAPAQLEPARSPWAGTFAVGAGVLAGVLRPASAALSSEAGLVRARLRGAFGVLWTVPQRVSHGPGSLRELVLSGTARLCVAPAYAPTLRFDLCSGLFAGATDVHARGYTTNQAKTRAWLAVPLGFSLSYLGRPAGFELSALALAPLYHHDFSVTGVGTAYHSWPLALTLSVAAIGSWP